jgi:hypothetical protein
MNLLAIALITAAHAPARTTYRLESVWSIPLEGYVSFANQSRTSIDTTAGRIDVASGRRVEAGAAPDSRILSVDLTTVNESTPAITIDGQLGRVVWENDRFKVAIDRARSPFNLYQIDAKSDRTLGKLAVDRPLYDEGYLSGRPESGWMFASATAIYTGRQATMTYLIFLSPPRYSPLRFIRFHDIRDFNRMLGVSISPKQSFGDVSGMSYTPETPLAMGNAYTGKVEWTNDKCSWGQWVGPQVLAQVRRGRVWVVLDGRNGRIVPSSLPQLANSEPQHDVRVVGRRIVLRRISPDERSTVITCYELIKR